MELILDEEKLSQRIPEFSVMEVQEELQEETKQIEEWLKNSGVTAIAANQLGSEKRLFAVLPEKEAMFFCNPMIVKQKGLHVALAEDPSLPGRQFLIARNDEITLDYQTIYGTNEERVFKQDEGGDLLQQLVQRLDGVSIADYGLEIFDDFMQASDAERQEVIEYYLDSLKEQQQNLQADIDSDKDAKQIQDAITFITKAAAGEIEIQKPERIMPKVGRKERRRLKRKGLLDALVDPITNRYRDLSAKGRMK